MGRYRLVPILLVLTGLARMTVHPAVRRPLALPTAGPLLAGSGWRVQATESARWGMPFRQWTLRDSAGRTAFLYLATTGSVKTILHWSGELGYQGEGYLVQGRGSRVLRLSTGAAARVSVVRIARLAPTTCCARAGKRSGGLPAPAIWCGSPQRRAPKRPPRKCVHVGSWPACSRSCSGDSTPPKAKPMWNQGLRLTLHLPLAALLVAW
jgi:hypothetical protein